MEVLSMERYSQDEVKQKIQSYLQKVQTNQPSSLRTLTSKAEKAFEKKHGKEMSVASKVIVLNENAMYL